MPGEQFGEHVGEHALGDPARVKAQTGWTTDDTAFDVDLDAVPARIRARTGRAARRCERQGVFEADPVLDVAVITRGLDLGHQRGVD